MHTDQQIPPYVYCKVCEVLVPRRKLYNPKICEACQKFFQRHCRDPSRLKCSTGSNACTVSGKDNRNCYLCRYKKCMQVGMKSKYMNVECPKRNNSPDGNSVTLKCDDLKEEPTDVVPAESLASMEIMPFASAAVENVLRLSLKAFTELHALEFAALKRPTVAVTNRSHFLQLAMSQCFQVIATSHSYALHFAGDLGIINHDEANALGNAAMLPIMALFNNLRGNKGAYYFGIEDSLLPQVFEWYPGMLKLKDILDELSTAFEQWNPTMAEASLLLSYLFFNDDTMLNPKIQRIRRLILLSFNLQASCYFKDDVNAIGNRQRHFLKCLNVTKTAIAGLQQSLPFVDYADPMCVAVVSTIEASTKKQQRAN